MKHWEKAINHKWSGGANHVFLPYLNVADYILNDSKLESMQDYLISSSVVGKAALPIFFNRGMGFYFRGEKDKQNFAALCQKIGLSPVPGLGQTKVAHMLQVMSEIMTVSWHDERIGVREALKDSFPERLQKKNGDPVVSLVVEYLETIVPPDAATSSRAEDRDALVCILEMARSNRVASSRNIAVLLTESINAVAPPLRAEVNGISPIKIELPDAGDREQTADFLFGSHPKILGEMPIDQFVHLTSGMTLVAIAHLVKEAAAKKVAVTPELIFKAKKKYIKEQSGGLLEIIEVPWGINAIGGLPEHKKYILEIVEAMRDGDFLAVPMGILLLGAVGLGKTVFMQAIAHEVGIPFLKMKNTRVMWVGQSERNQDFSIEIAKAMAPAVIGLDELDQQQQKREAMFDNTGVNNRMQGQLFEVMSDTDLRGRLLWMGISNMPNLLDAALLDRFEDRIPFFPQDHASRAEILLAILEKMRVQAAQRNRPFEWKISGEFCREFGWKSHFHLRPGEGLTKNCDPDLHPRGTEREDEWPMSGRRIEKLISEAYRMARIEKAVLGEKHIMAALEALAPTRDILEQKELTDLAILYANSDRFIPEGKWRKRAATLRSQGMQNPQTTRMV